MNPIPESFETWGLLEVMGHKKYAGWIFTRQIGNSTVIQVDVPAIDGIPAFSKIFNVNSMFGITPLSESLTKRYAERIREKPIYVFAWDDEETIDTSHQLGTGVETDDEEENEHTHNTW